MLNNILSTTSFTYWHLSTVKIFVIHLLRFIFWGRKQGKAINKSNWTQLITCSSKGPQELLARYNGIYFFLTGHNFGRLPGLWELKFWTENGSDPEPLESSLVTNSEQPVCDCRRKINKATWKPDKQLKRWSWIVPITRKLWRSRRLNPAFTCPHFYLFFSLER